MKIKYLLCFTYFIYILLFSFCIKKKNRDYISISIKSDNDSSEIGFCSISLFKKEFVVKDTFADIDGNYTIVDKNNIEGVILKSAGYYPEFKTVKELESNKVILMKTSEILSKTGGIGIDSILCRMNESLELKINNWNSKYKK